MALFVRCWQRETEIRRQLHDLGIRRSSLFLDLENLAADLAGLSWQPFTHARAKLRVKPGS
jgi:hypothetical protein